ncbi:MAG: tetratricopeptide repeat protein [Planctomycetes bacterium]|nr:tetratricopeptide repeat protein [Planctomycetota bacterium]
MTMECLAAVKWDDPNVVAGFIVGVCGIVGGVIVAIINRRKSTGNGATGGGTTVNPEITVAPKIGIENNPRNVFEPTVKVGLDEKDVGKELGRALDPLKGTMESQAARMASLEQGQQALMDQLTQLAPKQPVPDTGDPLKIKAVELFNAGVDAYHEGEIGQAIGRWLSAVELDPEYAAAHNNLGIALKDKGDLDAAIEHFNAALRIDPDYADAHYNLGIALQAKGDLDAAIEHYNAALRIDPEHAKAHYNLGNALQAKGDLDAAIEHYNAALRIDPDDARAHNNLAIALAQKGDAAAAVTALAKAIELDERYRGWAKTDTNYDSIRDDPAFRKLVYGE